MDLSMSLGQVLGGFLLIGLLVAGIIYYLRSRLNSVNPETLAEKHKGENWVETGGRDKYPEVNPFNWSSTVWLFGLALSILISIFAFSLTEYDDDVFIPDDALVLDEEIEIEPPRTAEPPPPPPPPPVIEEVPEEEIEEEEEPVFQDQSVEEEQEILEEKVEVKEEAPPPPPPPPPPPEPEVEEIFKIVEQKPRFPGCEDMSGSNAEKQKCAEEKMVKFIYSNIKYPTIAKENGIEGKVYIQFVVGKTGMIEDAKIMKDIGGKCGDEALRVVELMNNMPQKWTPGKQRGRAVKVLYTLPVIFKLE